MVIKKVQNNSGCSLVDDPSYRKFFLQYSVLQAIRHCSIGAAGVAVVSFQLQNFIHQGKETQTKRRCNDFANLLITITVFFIFVFFIMSKKKCQGCNHNLQMNFRYMSIQRFFTLSQLSLLGQTEKKSECKKIIK